MRKLKQSLLISAAIMSIGGSISSWASSADRTNFSTATSTLLIPKLNVDGVNMLNSVGIKLNFATQTFSIEGFTPVPPSSIELEQLSDSSFRFNAAAGKSYVIEIFNVDRNLGDIRGDNCKLNYTNLGLGLKISDSSATIIESSCEANGSGNIHNYVQFDAGLGGQFQVDVVPNLAGTDIAGKFSIRVQPKYDDQNVAWDTNFEPNNIGLSAAPINLGAQNSITSNIEERNTSFGTNQVDFDWYQFNASPDQQYVIEIYNVIRLLGTETGDNCQRNYTRSGLGLKITDSLFTEIASTCEPSGTGNTHNRVTFKSGIGGVFHIGIIPNSRTAYGTYSLRALPFHDAPANSWDTDHEPNNHPTNAFLIPLSEVVPSKIEERNTSYSTNSSDLDYYRFEGEANQTYQVELLDVSSNLKNSSGGNCRINYTISGVGLKVLDSQFVELASQCSPIEESNIHNFIQFKTGLSGVYYIGVIPNAENAFGTYNLRVLKQ
ncbi:MAG: hypothetical protein GQ581_06200 [Methyloprofundus sp.]|nr:hypothetical protein [Methyloprofundus sp.]